MVYDLKTIDAQIGAIEEGARKLKELTPGFEAVEKNVDAILAFVYILRRSISDVID